MSQPEKVRGAPRRYRLLLAWAIVIVVGVALYTYRPASSPPGFFVDESSIAYNAYTISQTGQDELGNSWPLYFRAFGDYKNPVQVYLLAALFKLTGPSILTARLLGAIAGVATALLLGWLATRVSHRREVGLLVAASALLTPWLFELSRVAFEVALYPMAVTLFLLSVHNVSTKAKWKWFDVVWLVSTLVLLTYTYSIGRLLAPLLALGLVVFATYSRWPGILQTWGLYILTLLPMVVFQQRHADALTGRFRMISYIRDNSSITEIGSSFIKHYLGNLNPIRLLVTGDTDVSHVAHVPGIPAFLAATMVVVIVGAWLLVRRHLHDAWWRFILYGLLVTVVPASLTSDYFHILRLSPLPVFLIVLTIPAFGWFLERTARRSQLGLSFLVVLTVAQAAIIQHKYHAAARSPLRLRLFDAEYPAKILRAALSAAGGRSIYVADQPTGPRRYVQAYWYATLLGIPSERFVILGPSEAVPENAVVITTDALGPRCRIVSQSEGYTVCATVGSPD